MESTQSDEYRECKTCRKIKHISEFRIGPDLRLMRTCNIHRNKENVNIATWEELVDVLEATTVGSEVLLDACIKLCDLPFHCDPYDFEDAKLHDKEVNEKHKGFARKLLKILCEKADLDFILKIGRNGLNGWLGIFHCRERRRAKRGGIKRKAGVDPVREQVDHLFRHDCRGKVNIWIYPRNIRIFIRHTRHEPAASFRNQKLVHELANNPYILEYASSHSLNAAQSVLRKIDAKSRITRPQLSGILKRNASKAKKSEELAEMDVLSEK